MGETSVFLSHISEEAPQALEIKKHVEASVPGSSVFVSAADIHLGDAWLKELDDSLSKSQGVIVLCSTYSIARPWPQFESGGGWSRKLPVIPVCHRGLSQKDLPHPLSIFQAMDLEGPSDCRALAMRVADILRLELDADYDFTPMASKLARPKRQPSIGIVLSNGQGDWESGSLSVFEFHKELPVGLNGSWSFVPIRGGSDLISTDLHRLTGVILGNPWRSRMTSEEVTALVEWVHLGGRMLLLGFELGDHHHEGNLGDVASHFGIQPYADIVAPPGHGESKPYDVPVDFDVSEGDPHTLTEGIPAIRLANVQTLRVAPGGTEWLRVGAKNSVYRPGRDSAVYRKGKLDQPHGSGFDINDSAEWLPVAVQAPKGLCGRGAAQAIGTWDLLGRKQSFDNFEWVGRLLDWLSG